jgi:predicted glycoside hydrolase/deacetylase ChbG (UPF0249 family)
MITSKQLIVNADDFGVTPDVTSGILTAHQDGIVTASTAMMNFPGTAEALIQAHECYPDLGLGVHLVLTSGPPLLPAAEVSTLVQDNGDFRSLRTFIEAIPQVILDEARAEMRAQIERFLVTGLTTDHIDSHHHITLFHPSLFEIMLDLAAEYGVPIRQPIPESIRAYIEYSTVANIGHRFHSLLNISTKEEADDFWRTAMSLLANSGVICPDFLIDTFYGTDATLEHLLQIIDNLPTGVSEIMCHPGYVSEELRVVSSYVSQRQTELAIPTHPVLRAQLAEKGIQLTTFARMKIDQT